MVVQYLLVFIGVDYENYACFFIHILSVKLPCQQLLATNCFIARPDFSALDRFLVTLQQSFFFRSRSLWVLWKWKFRFSLVSISTRLENQSIHWNSQKSSGLCVHWLRDCRRKNHTDFLSDIADNNGGHHAFILWKWPCCVFCTEWLVGFGECRCGEKWSDYVFRRVQTMFTQVVKEGNNERRKVETSAYRIKIRVNLGYRICR